MDLVMFLLLSYLCSPAGAPTMPLKLLLVLIYASYFYFMDPVLVRHRSVICKWLYGCTCESQSWAVQRPALLLSGTYSTSLDTVTQCRGAHVFSGAIAQVSGLLHMWDRSRYMDASRHKKGSDCDFFSNLIYFVLKLKQLNITVPVSPIQARAREG